MDVWRIHVKPDAIKGADPLKVCLKQGVIGIGWGVSTKPANKDEYWELGEKKFGGRGWSSAARAILWRMKIGDLVWTRDSFGVYYLGKITGDWEYRDNQQNIDADVINVRPCKLYKVGTSVAGKIVNQFMIRATVQRIEDKTAKLFSIIVYNRLSGEKLSISLPNSSIDIFSLLSDVVLEDIVGLYLQRRNGWLLLPSSRDRHGGTIAYEYKLIDPRSGEHIYVQVKSGDIKLDPRNYYKFNGKYYLFSPAGYKAQSKEEHVICIARQEIEKFLEEAYSYLPLNVKAWLDWRRFLQRGLYPSYPHLRRKLRRPRRI